MKYRIVQNGNGYYKVQYKNSFFGEWITESAKCDAFPKRFHVDLGHQYGDGCFGEFASLENAKVFVTALIEEHERQILKNKITVVEEY